MAEIKFTIPGTLPSLNELIDAERANKQKGAKVKKGAESVARLFIRQQIRKARPRTPVTLHYHFVEPTRRRDKDNISGFAHKVIQDALVKEGIIQNDGWDYVEGFTDSFSIDKKNPRIEVWIEERKEHGKV